MNQDQTEVFPLQVETNDEYPQAIKWTIVNTKYEIYVPTLKEFSVAALLPHCLDVKSKIDAVVSTEAHRAPSYFRVLPRTVSTVLQAIWEQLLGEDDAPAQDQDGFASNVRRLVALHCTEDDRYELAQQLRNPSTKPKGMAVQTFYYRLTELNSYISWLPGTEPALTDAQLKQALHDAMPSTWRERFSNAGNSVSSVTKAEMVRYFRVQQKNSLRRTQENDKKQRIHAKKRRNDKGSPKETQSQRPFKKAKRKDEDSSSKKSKRVQDTEQCPVHPNLPHTWGECNANAYNKNAKRKKDSRKSNANPPDKEVDNNAIDLDVDLKAPSSDEESVINNKGTSSAPNSNFADAYYDATNHHFNAAIDVFQTDLMPQEASDLFATAVEDAFESGVTDELDNLNDLNIDNKSLKLRPMGIMLAKLIQNAPSKRPLKVLFDSGSDATFIHQSALPEHVAGKRCADLKINTLSEGHTSTNRKVTLKHIQLPEFSPTRKIDKAFSAYVFNKANCKYDLIIGLDVMIPLGIDVLTSSRTVRWQGLQVPFRSKDYFLQQGFEETPENESFCMFTDTFVDNIDCFSVTNPLVGEIKSNTYSSVQTDEIAFQQSHLSRAQQKDLATTLAKFPKLFSGKLGKFPGFKAHLELKENAQPFSRRPYPVAHAHRALFKEELDRLVSEGVLSRCGPSEYLSPTFLIPKKDGKVRWVSDFRTLNSMIKRKVYSLPIIQDVLRKRAGYQFFTKIDISMYYYTFELDEESKNLCAICTPFGNYRYNRLPMGVSQSPDMAQEIIETLFRDLDETDVYIDDVGVFSNSWSDHIASLHKVLKILQDGNFTVNPAKCEWGVQETDWLGYWLTPTGLKPWKKKIDAILQLERPQTVSQLRSFIGAVTFYRDMYPKRSHLLAPLTALVGKKKLVWTPDCEKSFKAVKALLAKDAFLKYPNHNKPFHVYCDASDLQLGAVIMQDDQPVAFYSRKLNAAQRNYTVGEKEILSIVETLKEFRTTLFGCKALHVHTDHKNLLYNKMSSQRVMRWRLLLEEYMPIFHYIKGAKNALADAMSRLPFSQRQNNGMDVKNPADIYRRNGSLVPSTDSFYTMAIDDDDLLDCFVHLPASSGVPFVLDYATIAAAQGRDASLTQLALDKPQQYVRQLLAPETEVLCYIKEPNAPWKIVIPDELLRTAIQWYHLSLGHIGTTRLIDTLSMHFYNRNMRNLVEEIVSTCDACQRYKLVGRGHGELAPREAALVPWQDVAVDLIGPWQMNVQNVSVTFGALTIIDLVTNLTEVVRIANKTAAHVALIFENTWLSRYPRPVHCTFDQGGEFIGFHFQNMLARHGIHARPISAKNPQANSICERMHQTIGNSLRAMSTMNPPEGITTANQLVDTAIANASYALRATIHSALKTTPGALAFSRDMVLNIPVISDLATIQQNRQQLINNRLIVANRKRFSYDYTVGQEVLKLVYQPKKLDPRAEGPYRIETVHTNGTVTIRLSPTVIERISIRRIKPYRR